MAKLNDGFEDDAFNRFHAAWLEARGQAPMPDRRAISLRLFAKFIKQMQILNRVEPRVYRYRQLGEDVKGGLKVVGAGDDGFALIDEAVQPACADFIEAMFLTPVGGIMEYSVEYPSAHLGHIRTVHLPIRDEKTGETLIVAFNSVVQRKHLLQANDQLCLGKQYCRGILLAPDGTSVLSDAGFPNFEVGDPAFMEKIR